MPEAELASGTFGSGGFRWAGAPMEMAGNEGGAEIGESRRASLRPPKGLIYMPTSAELISKDDLTAARVLEIYQHAYFDASLDPDGEIKIVLDGIKMYAIAEPQRGLLRLRVGVGIRPGVTRQQALEFCNRVNDKLIFIRACVPAAAPQLVVIFDHFLDTTVGVTGLEIIDETRRVRTVMNSLPALDTDKVLS